MQRFFKRGFVFKIKFVPPNDPAKSIDKFVVCLQEGKIVEKSADFTAALITTKKVDKIRPWEVYLSPQECRSSDGAKVQCNKIHTIPKEWIEKNAYTLSDATMEEVDQKLMLGVGLVKYEDLEEDL